MREGVVMRCKDDGAWEVDQSVVKGCNRFEVEVVGGLIEDEEVGSFDHDARKHATHLFSS